MSCMEERYGCFEVASRRVFSSELLYEHLLSIIGKAPARLYSMVDHVMAIPSSRTWTGPRRGIFETIHEPRTFDLFDERFQFS